MLSLAILTACSPELDAELLSVDGITVDRIEPGTLVQIYGSDFPVGRDIQIEFRGHMHRPGAEPTNAIVDVDARSVSGEAIEFVADAELVDRMGGRGTFVGDLRASLLATSVVGRVSGVLRGVEIDFDSGALTRLSDEVERLHLASAAMEYLGLELRDAEAFDGLLIERVRPGSPANLAGLGRGDRIRTIDGVRIRARADFIPVRGAAMSRLEVIREGESLSVPVNVSTADLFQAPAARETRGWFVLLGAMALLLLFIAPTARTTGWLVDRGWSRRSVVKKHRVGATGSERARQWMTRVGVVAIPLLALAVLPHLDRWWPSLTGLVAVIAGVRLAQPLTEARQLSSFAFRLRGHGASLLSVVLCATTTAMMAGSQYLPAVQDAQGPWPWQWFVFAHPLCFALFPVFMVSAFALPPSNGRDVVAATLRQVYWWLAAILGTFLFFGGSFPLDEEGRVGVLTTIAFVAKAGVVLWIGRRIRRSRVRPGWWLVGLSLAGASISAALLLVDPPAGLLAASGPVLAASTAGLGLYLLGRRLWPDRPVELQRFL